jgi:hypothetical protein
LRAEDNVQDFVRESVFFNAKGDSSEDPLHHSKITEYVRAKFMVLRATGFREAITEMDSKGDAPEEADDEEEDDDGEPSASSLRRTQPDAYIHDAKHVCLKALENVDNVEMLSCAFEDFSKRADIQSLFGTVALVLTDPPYNTRREAGANKSENDKLSLSIMKEAADIIEKLLRSHGHASIFCSIQQAME